jgi:hypothetical protein
MKSKGLRWKVRGGALGVSMALATLAVGVTGLLRAHAADQSRLPASFSGLLNDYTPPVPAVPGGPGAPYEMHGKWSLHLREERGSATFSAEMTMETGRLREYEHELRSHKAQSSYTPHQREGRRNP